MTSNERLKRSFLESEHQLAGHGKRDVKVLKEAFEGIDGNVESDIYGQGTVIEEFQEKMAELLGKENAVFFPSGTMAQQIALRIWCDAAGIRKVAYHPLSHLEIHEEKGLQELHGIESVLLADKDRVIELEDVLQMDEKVACVLLELPQREIGGQLPSYITLEEISAYCRKNEIKLHLDGARLLEVLPYYGKTASEVCGLFDSVYISLYKGIGGIAGAILAGDKEFMAQSKVWKRRHGGDLISLYPYILSADYYFDKRSKKMAMYHEHAKELAGFFNSCEGITTLPVEPVSNMFHVHFSYANDTMEELLAELHQETGIGLTSYLKTLENGGSSYEVSLGDLYETLPAEKVEELFAKLNEKMKTLK
ncbi:low specificity L-threonine aldolase [Planococcus sp. 107-1]|uniref:threonine aldolase family protein n=1 Tax=Planococcus sp. 107-1 TaxID=2908840 RepID=UPI001F3748AD|nr:beta-eliminating lyase-related protein [Planococcus sp. 107-1]UJF26067.1 beta-eliminating lyase-related protein [Planococcus sp. 107-1]